MICLLKISPLFAVDMSSLDIVVLKAVINDISYVTEAKQFPVSVVFACMTYTLPVDITCD